MIMNIPGYTGTSGGLLSGDLNLPGYTGQSGGSYGTDYLGQAANMAGVLQNLGVNTEQTSGGFFGDVLGGLRDIGSAISPAMPAIAGSLLTKEAYDRLSDIGTQSLTGVTVDGQRIPGAMEVAQRGQRESQFRPFTVTTPTGSMFSARMGGQPSMGQPMAQPVGQPSMMLPPGMDELNRQDEELRRQLMSLPQNIRGGTDEFGRMPMLGMGEMDLNNLPPMARISEQQREDIRRYQNIKNKMDEVSAERRRLSPLQLGLLDGPLTNFTEVPVGQLAQQQPTTGGLEVGMTLSPQEQAMQQQLLSGAGGFFGQAVQPTQAREQAIFERMRAAQRPEEERQRLALEERLAGQGRLGVSSAAYGGATPEMLAMATAQEEARNRSMLGAMQQAQAEQMQQAGLGQQFLGAGYIPQSQLLAAAQPGIQQQQLAQQAQQFGTGLFGETMMSGLEARLLAEQARANLLGGVGSNILAGMFTPQVNQRTGDVTSAGGLDVGSIIEGVGSGLGGLFGTIFGSGK